MASRQLGYGLTGEVNRKLLKKYEDTIDEEQQARIWIETILQEEMKPGADPDVPLGWREFGLALKDGEMLCRIMNILQPGSVKLSKKVNSSKVAAFKGFNEMENISKFIEAAEKYGVKRVDLFQTADLFDLSPKAILSVRNTIHALGRRAQSLGFDGPVLGPKEAEINKRDFDEETLQKGKTVIGAQMGAHKGASQSGMNFGKSRSIID